MAADSKPRPLTVLSVQPMAELGGSDQAMLRLARQLAMAGWSVHIALPGSSPMAERYEETGAHLHTVPMLRISTSHGLGGWLAYALAWPGSVLRLWRLARQVRPDVVHTNSLHSWYAWVVSAALRRPHIWHAREMVTQSSVALRLERFLCRHFATSVIAVSQAVADQLAPTKGRPANVVVVHEGTSPEEHSPSRAGRARPRFNLADDRPLVGYVGRIDTWKGVDVLLDAVPLLLKLVPDAQVVIAGGAVRGKEDYAAHLKARADECGAVWVGQVSGSEAADLLADLDCLAYPSTGPEPWGLSLVEALASGAPVVSTDAGGPREVTAGLAPTSALLVPPQDPAALAGAVASVLPASTSAERRRARQPLLQIPAAPYPEIFASVAARLPLQRRQRQG
jgi:glycosyltransferase involved in cell wall biosynthesis